MGKASVRLDDFHGRLGSRSSPAPRLIQVIGETLHAPVADRPQLKSTSGSIDRADVIAEFSRSIWAEEIDSALPCYDFRTLMEEIPIVLPPIRTRASDDEWMPQHERCLMLIDVEVPEGDLQYLALVTRNEGELEIGCCERRRWDSAAGWDLCPWTVAVGGDGIGLVFYSNRYNPHYDYVPVIEMVVESVRMGTEILTRSDIIFTEITTPTLRELNAIRKQAGLAVIPPTRQVSLA